jgi:hypothetical protein
VQGCNTPSEITEPYAKAFRDLQAGCSCQADELFAVLKRIDLIIGPARREIDASLAHEHLPLLSECRSLSPKDLDGIRDDLVARVHRAASLQVARGISRSAECSCACRGSLRRRARR